MTQPDQLAKRVLVVDDDTALAKLICEFLTTAAGLKVDHVGDGEAALEAWKRDRPNLLIVDYALPGMNGLELLTALRLLNGSPVRAIMISGTPVGDEAMSHGARAFLAKPFPMQRLLADVVRVLGSDPEYCPVAAITKGRLRGGPPRDG